MEKFIIEGGHQLSGSVTPGGSKNEVLPVIASTLVADGPIELSNVPRIADVLVMFEMIENMGGSVTWTGQNTCTVDTRQVRDGIVPAEHARQLRASILFAGPLLARFGKVVLPPPGGDSIGRRRLDTHMLGFRKLGADVTFDKLLTIEASDGLKGADIFLDEPSVTGTENIIMAAVIAKGE